MNLLKNILRLLLFLLITVILIEFTATILLKIDFFEKKSHSFLTMKFTEITKNEELNLKKNFSFNEDGWQIYTDKNRLRVNEKDFNHNLSDNNKKIIFIGDSVPFGYGVDYKDSIPGNFSKFNSDLLSINASVPSYTFTQSVDKYIKEFKNIKKIKYVYLSSFNPLDLYVMFGKNWSEKINWSNHVNYLSKDLFFFKYKRIFLWGDINFFSILRKIYIVYFFKSDQFLVNSRDNESDKRLKNYINAQLNRLHDNLDKNSILILTPILSPLQFKKNDDFNNIDNQRLEVINLMNNEIKNFKKKNIIYFDSYEILNLYNPNDLFIDDCCHLTPFASYKIAENLNYIVK